MGKATDVTDATFESEVLQSALPVLIDFWAPWRGPCKAIAPIMVQIQADYEPKGVQLIVINANDVSKVPDDSFPNMKQHAKEKGFNFPYLFDESQTVAQAYGVERTSEVFLFDRQGQLRYHGAITDNYDDPAAVKDHYLWNALDAVLGAKPLGLATTQPRGCTIKWK